MRRSSIALSLAAAVVVGVAAGYFLPRYLPGPAQPGAAAASAEPVAEAAARPIPVEAVEVVLGPLAQRLSAVGSLVAEDAVMIRPEIAGRIREIRFSEGQSVRRGDVLLRLDDDIPRAELEQARANYALARSKYARAEQLQKQGFISAQGRDEATNSLQVERANVALAEARLVKTEIRAPFDGEIGLRTVSVGDYVNAGQDLVTLQAIDQLKVDFRIPEVYITQIAPGQRLDIALDAIPGRTWQGKVTAISPLVEAGGRALVMRALVDNSDGTLRPGMFARVNLLLSEQEALLVPETAITPRDNRQFVFRIEDGVVQGVPVQVGQRSAGMVEIVEGLAPGDQVVTAGLQKIQDGSRVAVTLIGPN